MLLDTGLDPSAIDLKRAEAMGLSVHRDAGEEAAGEGNDASAQIYPTAIDQLASGALLPPRTRTGMPPAVWIIL